MTPSGLSVSRDTLPDQPGCFQTSLPQPSSPNCRGEIQKRSAGAQPDCSLRLAFLSGSGYLSESVLLLLTRHKDVLMLAAAPFDRIAYARRILGAEAAALETVAGRLSDGFNSVADALF